MAGIVGTLLQNVILGMCLVSPVVFFFSLAAFLGLLPAFLRFMHGALRVTLILSYRLYQLVLAGVTSLTGVDIVQGWLRVVASTILSTVIGIAIHLVAEWPLWWWSVGLCVLHGLCVGLAWDEIERPGGVQVGVRLQ